MDASHDASESSEMHRATSRARETSRFFFRELAWERRRTIPVLDLAAVRAPLDEGMWMNDVTFDGRDVHGTPLRSHERSGRGARLRVPLAKIADWMYAVDGRVYGGFTLGVARARMPLAERKRHDHAWSLEFSDPDHIELVPRDWFLPKRSLLDKLFGRGDPLPNLATAEHPMALSTERALRSELLSNPGVVHETDEEGFTFLHHRALSGDPRGARAALEVGADPLARTPAGVTPIDLARTLGWQDVVTLLEAYTAKVEA